MVLKFITWDVEHGSAAYIKTPNGKHIAIDLGARRATDSGFSPLVHLRKNWGVQELDLVVITHPHLDHIEDISNFRSFKPKVLMRPNHLTDNDIWGNNQKASPETRWLIQEYININRDYNRPTSPVTRPSSPANFGGVSLKFFVPKHAPRENINNHSVVTVMSYGGVKFLMPGDNEPPSWSELLKDRKFVEAIGGTHVLVAPHHGRESGFHGPLFRVIRPLSTIISDGNFVDTSATSLYSERTEGWQVNRRNGRSDFRKCVTTRKDGPIDITVTPPSFAGGKPTLNVTID